MNFMKPMLQFDDRLMNIGKKKGTPLTGEYNAQTETP